MNPLLGYSQAEFEARQGNATASEIAQQPALWREVQQTLAPRQTEIEAFLRPVLEQENSRIVLTGAGTSAFIGQVLAPVLSERLRRRVDAVASTDIVSNPKQCFAEDRPTLLVSFARSGDSPESVGATQLAERCLSHCYHLVVTCNRNGQLHRDHARSARREQSFVALMPQASEDRGFAMTSSFTCMMFATLSLLGEELSSPNRATAIASAATRIMDSSAEQMRALVAGGFERVVYLGSGPLQGLARESALKLLELTAGEVLAYADSPLGFRHGPKSMINDRTLVLIYLSNDAYTRRYDLDLLAELRREMNPESVIAITADGRAPAGNGRYWLVEGLEQAPDSSLVFPYVIYAQTLALHFSLAYGKSPDSPFDSGEVNRVVQGVTIHPF